MQIGWIEPRVTVSRQARCVLPDTLERERVQSGQEGLKRLASEVFFGLGYVLPK